MGNNLRTRSCLGPVIFSCIYSTMSSLVRAALKARPRPAITLSLQRRQASSSAVSHTHEEHHDEYHESDGTHEGVLTLASPTPAHPLQDLILIAYIIVFYFLEGFATPFWRNTVLFSILTVGFYKFAPAPGEDVYLTRYIAQFQTPREIWAAINEKHVNAATVAGEELLLQHSATRPRTHRYRYPQ